MSVKMIQENLSQAEVELMDAKGKVTAARAALKAAMLIEKPLTADDYRIEILADVNGYYWTSTEAMLSDVLGDYSPDDACGAKWTKAMGCTKKEWLAGRAAVEAENKRWADAYEGGEGISAWSGILYVRDPATNTWSVEDSIGGYFAVGNCWDGDVEEAIRYQLTPMGMDKIELADGDDLPSEND